MLKEFRARTLQWYVLREYLITFALTLSVSFLLLGIIFLFFKADEFSKYGISLGKALLMMPYLMPKPLALAIPPAAMIAAIMVFGRLSAENEIISIQAGGAPLRTVVLPLILASVLMSGLCLFCNQWAMRYGIERLRSEVFRVNKEDFFTQLEKPGNTVALPLDDNSVLRINWLPYKKDAETGRDLRPLHIVMFKNQQIEFSIFAEDYKASFPGMRDDKRVMLLTVRNAQLFRDPPGFLGETTAEFLLPSPATMIDVGGTRGERGWLDNLTLAENIIGSIPLRRQFQLQRAAELGASMIAASPGDPSSAMLVADAWTLARGSSEAIHGTGGARERARFEQAEAYSKIAMSILPISMVVLGMGLGLLVQKRQRLVGFVVGIFVLALVYYPIQIVCKELARADRADNLILFLPNLILLIGGYAVWRGYERGLQLRLPRVLDLGVKSTLQRGVSGSFEMVLSGLRGVGDALVMLTPFGRRKTDGLVAGSFIGVLLGVLICMGTIIIGIDLIENGSQVINGIVKAGEPLPGMPARTELDAVLDAASFYAIRTLETLISMLPQLVMLAALLAVNAMVRNNEHLIFKSSGISLQRGFRPIIWIAVVISIGSFGVRELLLPKLIIARDTLRPQVYHRQPPPQALALHTRDANGTPVLFEMSEYSTLQKVGRNLRIHEMTDNGRFPTIVANKAEWTGSGWKLSTEVVTESKKKDRASGLADKPILETKHLDHGWLIAPQAPDATEGAPFVGVSNVPIRNNKTEVKEWSGAVTPILIDSDRVGPGVMRLRELKESAQIRPAFEIEWWKRISEWVMTLVLLWLCIPLIVSETWSIFKAAGVIIFIAALYWGLNLGVAEAAQLQYVPVFAPVILHSVLLLAGVGLFYRRMAT